MNVRKRVTNSCLPCSICLDEDSQAIAYLSIPSYHGEDREQGFCWQCLDQLQRKINKLLTELSI